jgi:hypothetical protein
LRQLSISECFSIVMAGLVPAIHAATMRVRFLLAIEMSAASGKLPVFAWMAASSAVVTLSFASNRHGAQREGGDAASR